MSARFRLPTGPFWDFAISVVKARKRLGYLPRAWAPRTFNEFVLAQKLKFDGDLGLARRLTDKVEFKRWLDESGMQQLAVPTLGVFERVEEIMDATFRGEVVAKGAHGSGGVIIRSMGNGLSFCSEDAVSFREWLREDYYLRGRESNYKGLKPRIIVEPLLRDADGGLPKDIKVFCSKGIPFAIQVDIDRFTEHRRQLYTPGWELLPYSMCYPRIPEALPKPALLGAALDVARHFSSDFGLVRIDFYFTPDGLKVGEMTFFPGNGGERFEPGYGDRDLGRRIAAVA